MREGDTPLIDAARHARTADVAALLAGGADVSEPKTDGSGNIALHVASAWGHAKIVTMWEVFVMPHMVTRDYKPPPPPPRPSRRSARVAGRAA